MSRTKVGKWPLYTGLSSHYPIETLSLLPHSQALLGDQSVTGHHASDPNQGMFPVQD